MKYKTMEELKSESDAFHKTKEKRALSDHQKTALTDAENYVAGQNVAVRAFIDVNGNVVPAIVCLSS